MLLKRPASERPESLRKLQVMARMPVQVVSVSGMSRRSSDLNCGGQPCRPGKSTLARLLVRGADPDSGRILLEKRLLTGYALRSLRSAVCYVPQQPVLFQGTIRENLLYANARATYKEMIRAMQAAQLASVLSRLPHGLDASLGPGAINLSGGERQRLAVARSLLRESAAIVLDEATSALDVPTERAVLRSVAEFHTHQTIIVISHRIRSLAWVDRFVLLDQGRIVATGTHSVLYAQSALYRALFDAPVQDMIMPLKSEREDQVNDRASAEGE